MVRDLERTCQKIGDKVWESGIWIDLYEWAKNVEINVCPV